MQFGNGCLSLEGITEGHPRRRIAPCQPRGIGARLHISDHERDRLVCADWATECLALARVFDRFIDAALRQPSSECCDGDAAFVKNAQELGVPAPAFPNEIRGWHPDISE